MTVLRFLLDTDTAIGLLRNRETLPRTRFIEYAGAIAISSISVFELWYGAERSSDPTRNRHAVEELLSLLTTLDFDLDAASQAAEIRAALAAAGTPIGSYDLQIAAIARCRGLTVVTGNTREFERVPGLRCVDWLRA